MTEVRDEFYLPEQSLVDKVPRRRGEENGHPEPEVGGTELRRSVTTDKDLPVLPRVQTTPSFEIHSRPPTSNLRCRTPGVFTTLYYLSWSSPVSNKLTTSLKTPKVGIGTDTDSEFYLLDSQSSCRPDLVRSPYPCKTEENLGKTHWKLHERSEV